MLLRSGRIELGLLYYADRKKDTFLQFFRPPDFVRGSLKKERRYCTISLRDTRGYDLAANLPGLLRLDFDTEIDLLLLLSP
jgi:hypothetical protein